MNFPFKHEIHCSLVWIWQELSQSFRTHQHASIYTYALTYDEMGSSDFIPSTALHLKCVESYSACAFFLYITETAIRFNSQSLAHLHNGVKRFDLKQLNRNCWVEGFLIECSSAIFISPSLSLMTVFGHNGFYLVLKGSVKPCNHETLKEDQTVSTV